LDKSSASSNIDAQLAALKTQVASGTSGELPSSSTSDSPSNDGN